MALIELEAPASQDSPSPPRRRREWRQTRLPTVAHYLAFLQSGWLILIILTVLGAGLGVAYAQTVPRMWEASASIELPDLPVYVDLTRQGPPPKRATIDTTGQLAFSEPVLEAISDATGLSREQASEALTVSAYPLSRVIILTLTASTRLDAINGANAAANELVDQRDRVLAGSSDRANARELRKALRTLNDAGIQAYGGTPVSVRITQEIQNINENLQQYENHKAKVVNKAAPGKKVPPHSEVYVTTGAVTGFMVGVLWIWWRPRKRSRVEGLSGVNRGL